VVNSVNQENFVHKLATRGKELTLTTVCSW